MVDLIKNYIYGKFATKYDGEVSIVEDFWIQITDKIDNSILLDLLKDYLTCHSDNIVREKEVFKIFKQKFSTTDQIHSLLSELLGIVDFYIALSDANDEYWKDRRSDQKLIKSLKELNLFKNTKQYKSVVLAVHTTLPDLLSDVINIVKIVTFRYNIIGGKVANEIERAYSKLAQGIIKGDFTTVEQIKDQLKSVYISDDEFVSLFANVTIKHKSNKKIINYILNQINAHVTGAENSNTIEDLEATIEHILPQNSLGDYDFSPKDQDQYFDRLGNFTLLESTLNHKEASNANFNLKKEVFKKSKYLITKKIADYSSWNPDSLQNRQIYLANQAKAIWKF